MHKATGEIELIHNLRLKRTELVLVVSAVGPAVLLITSKEPHPQQTSPITLSVTFVPWDTPVSSLGQLPWLH